MNVIKCPCSSGLDYKNCCQPYHLRAVAAPTVTALMRSRYAAFVLADADYLFETTHFSKRKGNSRDSYLKSAKNTKWVKLEIIAADSTTVEFKAFYLNKRFQTAVLHEKSSFKLEDGKWYYVDGIFY
ncbi:YchJ family protein [Pedobacter sp. MR22-3]|uniref:YchJ family protein n=1 Tax=Pedobacter sp. MR22-3 TaxID=2994552 RepID=UPI0022475273|nr:YchJ family metal-binding protein [Pedobacter sp. MR22-3]MCX2584579.1 YchJ family metal-binding protein [Pedobacter sp. MR22-3]